VKAVPQVNYTVIETYPHDTTCFTQGLFINGSNHHVFESCGLYGQSFVKRYELKSGTTFQRTSVAPEVFSEGLALLGESMYMLTWQQGKILEFDARTFQLRHEHPFPIQELEGWGLTTDGCELFATTGSPYLYRLRVTSAGNIEMRSRVQVRHKGELVYALNEMEYITPKIWANQWRTNRLWRVDPNTGDCETFIDVGGLHNWYGGQTPNGIAYSAALGITKVIVTGKLWPKMFALEIGAADLCGAPISGSTSQLCKQAPESACWKSDLQRISAAGRFLTGAVPSHGSAALVASVPASIAQLGILQKDAAHVSSAESSQTSTAQVISRIAVIAESLLCIVMLGSIISAKTASWFSAKP